MLSNDIPTGLRVPAPAPLDSKLYVLTYSSLESLGASNNLAYSYYKGMVVYCVETDKYYKWRPKEGSEVGTLAEDFTYPNPFISNGITYSGQVYNFFLITGAEDITLRNVGTGIGLYKDFIIVGGVKYFNLKSLASNFMTITESEDGTINLDTTTSTSNLSFYIDINSVADTETGSLSSPFKTLNKALDVFIGTGTWYNPQYKGYKITMLSACNLLEAAGDDYNGYINLDINHLSIEGNGFYLGLYTNPSPDYYPISTRRMVTNMPKTANVLDYSIDMRFNNVTFQRTGTNAIVDNLNYSFPTATVAGAYPPQQNGVFVVFTSCVFTNDTARLPNSNWSIVSNPNDGGNPLILYGVPVYASNIEPIGVPMTKSEGRNWNKEGALQFVDCRWTNSTGTCIKLVDTSYQDYGYKGSAIQLANYFRYYETVEDDFYSPKLGMFMVELENVNYARFYDFVYNNTVPAMITTETIPRRVQIGGVEAVFKLINSLVYIDKGIAEEGVDNFIQLDGNSSVEIKDFVDLFVNCNENHKFFKVISPLPTISKSIFIENSKINEIVVDATGLDKSYVQYISGYKNTINNAPHGSYLSFTDDITAKASGLIAGNVYYNTTLGGLKVIN